MKAKTNRAKLDYARDGGTWRECQIHANVPGPGGIIRNLSAARADLDTRVNGNTYLPTLPDLPSDN
jgi:hypothetical protein